MDGGNKNGWSRSTGRYRFAIQQSSQTIINMEKQHAGPGQPILQQPGQQREMTTNPADE
jgi:hypothetical protein